MTSKRCFVLDANVFIEAYNRYYAFDLVPKFWSELVWRPAIHGDLCSIDRVRDELKDELGEWAKKHPDLFEKTDDLAILKSYAEVMEWAQKQTQYKQVAKDQFASVADGWLVAFARVKRLVVVTHEQPAPQSQKRIALPDVCTSFGVQYCNTFEMLRELGIKLS